ncbi:hypothetical protein ACO0LF_18235 [Undibacterium sp. Di27W]|uniref:hypothetical protein n=1 Tax=Undibacterium sp. Di27W TaxID=3413036 RepID=UPI003BF2D9DC
MHERKLMWGSQTLWQPMVSFTIATLITALLLFQLIKPWHKNAVPESSYLTLDFSPLLKIIPTLPTPPKTESKPEKKPSNNVANKSEKTEQATSRPASTTPQAQQTITPPDIPDAGKDLPTEDKASAPARLNIGKEAIAKAYADSRTDMPKIAGQTIQALEAAEAKKNRQFGHEVSKAKIEDCIRPNSDAGVTIGQTTFVGYLAVAALAYNAVTGKCK